MPINSRQKGCRGEREAAAELIRLLGVEACRGQQHCGSKDSPDIKHSLPKVHFEVKYTEKLQLYKAIEQAVKDAGENCPVVLHRANRQPWVAIVRLDDLPRLAVQVFQQLAARA